MTHTTRFAKLMRASFLIVLFSVAMTPIASAQAQSVNIDIRMGNYDVLYLADFIDVTTGALANAIPNAAISITTNPPGVNTRMYVVIRVLMKLSGDQAFSELVRAETNPFDMSGSITITSRDLARTGGGNISVRQTTLNSTLQKRLEDHVRTLPTAPVGSYAMEVRAFTPAGVEIPSPGYLEINVRNASPDEISVTMIEPQNGAIVPTLFPTFSWTAERAQARLSVYERLPFHRAPEDAITGLPHLQVDVQGSSYTYPPTASRRLEPGKSYVWFLEIPVSTNRGEQLKQGQLFSFRVQALGNQWAFLEQFMTSQGGEAAGTYSTLLDMGWQPSGQVQVDGRTVTVQQLQTLLNQISQRQQAGAVANVKVTIE
jgi:hypothetical protein